MLWQAQCRLLGERERLGNLVEAVEAVHSSLGEKKTVDWKQAYKELHKLTGKIRTLLLQYGECDSKVLHVSNPMPCNLFVTVIHYCVWYTYTAAAASAALKESDEEQVSSVRSLTSAQLRGCLTLREMLQLGERRLCGD